MAKKMCWRFIDGVPCVYRPMRICPKNTNSKCEIVAKPKMVRVKLRGCSVYANGQGSITTDKGEIIINSLIPILIDEKYLKGAK